jgi:hypothetical protein
MNDDPFNETMPGRLLTKFSVRPRISLLSALLLMTIVGMTIVLAQLWREVGPLRAELRTLRNETGRLSIDDAGKVHAIEVRTNEALKWKWRIWVPEGLKLHALANWGTVPHDGVPKAQCGVELEPGEQWVTLRVVRDSTEGSWIAQVETSNSGSGVKIDERDQWWQGPPRAMAAPGVGYKTAKADSLREPFVLARHHIGSPSVTNSSDLVKPGPPTTGFMVWLEPTK